MGPFNDALPTELPQPQTPSISILRQSFSEGGGPSSKESASVVQGPGIASLRLQGLSLTLPTKGKGTVLVHINHFV